jgi:MFS family permease
MNQMIYDQRGFFQAIIGDGRPLLFLTGLCLVFSGGFALFISITGHFLPHDIAFLGMTASQLCAINECRVVHFMIHDRVAFGGSLIAVGLLYVWMAEFPLRHRQVWSWWVFVITGAIGFGSFLGYLNYGYLDTWHGVATLLLLPCFVAGLILSYRTLPGPAGPRSLLSQPATVRWASLFGVGRALLLVTAAGMIMGGTTIMVVGMTSVFVPQDLEFMRVTPSILQEINPKLIPLIAHDRFGFGGGIATCGIAVLFCVWCGTPSRSLWQVLCLSGMAGFSTAVGVHPIVGYTDFLHLAPALMGMSIFIIGLALCFKPMCLDVNEAAPVAVKQAHAAEP